MESIYVTEGHVALRAQVANFLATEVEPQAAAWEEHRFVRYTCQQFHGGMGYLRATAIECLARDARAANVGGAATEAVLEPAPKRFVSD